ncbi:carbohydrate ABC transporter membrane protein 1, CUT1 family [Rhizobiales bacterium GAS191]|nr:carbohydrate ABC transporter membrane protein 1, CUT1 family [Rhizobiales bacterium GAS113]SEE14786.1 carbohydrate ABC transporter membrane protein 1, CUT1 family [Rhizobiales bacterium GAS191]
MTDRRARIALPAAMARGGGVRASASVAWRAAQAGPLTFLAPSFLIAALVILYPLWNIGVLATHEVNRFGQLGGFTGLANLLRVLEDPLFWPTLTRTLVWTLCVVAGAVLVSLPVALILDQDFAGRGLARMIIMLPWAVSLTMTAVVWRWALNGESGYVNAVLQGLGIVDGPVVWLAEAGTAFPVQILIGILVSVPFTVTLFLGGLASLPRDIYEATEVDGATRFQAFYLLTLPLMRPFVTMAVVLNVIYVFNSFPIIWVLTQGGPANSTDILVTYLYKLAFRFGRLGDAAALSLVMFAMLFAFTLVYVRLASRTRAA